MAGNGHRPRRGDALIADLWFVGATQAQMAQCTGLSERTIRRRLARPQFRDELQRRTLQEIARSRRRAVAMLEDVQSVLHGIATDPAQPAAARVRACEILWGRADPPSQRVDVAATVTPLLREDPLEQLAGAIKKAEERIGLVPAAPASNGKRGNGDG